MSIYQSQLFQNIYIIEAEENLQTEIQIPYCGRKHRSTREKEMQWKVKTERGEARRTEIKLKPTESKTGNN